MYRKSIKRTIYQSVGLVMISLDMIISQMFPKMDLATFLH